MVFLLGLDPAPEWSLMISVKMECKRKTFSLFSRLGEGDGRRGSG
jgi:hypothetical protein